MCSTTFAIVRSATGSSWRQRWYHELYDLMMIRFLLTSCAQIASNIQCKFSGMFRGARTIHPDSKKSVGNMFWVILNRSNFFKFVILPATKSTTLFQHCEFTMNTLTSSLLNCAIQCDDHLVRTKQCENGVVTSSVVTMVDVTMCVGRPDELVVQHLLCANFTQCDVRSYTFVCA